MKLFCFLLCFPFADIAQPADGAGPFHIGKTTIAVIDSIKGKGYKYLKTSSPSDYAFKTGKVIIEPYADTAKSLAGSPAALLPGHKTFKIAELSISGIDVANIVVDFYNGVLYKIVIGQITNTFHDALILKYGQPVIKRETNTVKCVGAYNGSDELEETAKTSTFTDSSTLLVYGLFSQSYGTDCSKLSTFFFHAENPVLTESVRLQEIAAKDAIEERINAKKRASFKDF